MNLYQAQFIALKWERITLIWINKNRKKIYMGSQVRPIQNLVSNQTIYLQNLRDLSVNKIYRELWRESKGKVAEIMGKYRSQLCCWVMVYSSASFFGTVFGGFFSGLFWVGVNFKFRRKLDNCFNWVVSKEIRRSYGY